MSKLPPLSSSEIEEIRKRCRRNHACLSQYGRLLRATSSSGTWEVLMDNIYWVISRDILTSEQRTPAVFLAAVKKYGYAVQYLTSEQRESVCM